MKPIFNQHIINFDIYTQKFFSLRFEEDNSFEKINSISNVLSFKSKYAGRYNETDEFFDFLNSQIFNNTTQQSNNHVFMRTLLAKRINTHWYINYDNLANYHNFKKIPKINLPAKNIISNKFITNQTETLLSVTSLEKKFLTHLKDGKYILNKKDTTFNDVRASIALHFARRENFLLETLYPQMEWHLRNQNKKEIDLLDYYYLKFFYNKAVIKNYNNYLNIMDTYDLNYIFKYEFRRNLNYNWVDVNNHKFEVDDSIAEDYSFAMNEHHTFFGFDFLNVLNQEEKLLPLNGFKNFTNEEYSSFQKTIFIVGDERQILFITDNDEHNFVEKLLFIIHAKWDFLMAHLTIKTLLISEKSSIFDIKFFQELGKNKHIINRNSKLTTLYNISEKYENIIKLYIKKN